MSKLTIIAIVAFSFVGLLLILNVFVLPFVRKNVEKKREVKLAERVSAFKRGDKILLASGIRGYFIKKKGDVLYVEISEGVTIQVDKHAVMGVYT